MISNRYTTPRWNPFQVFLLLLSMLSSLSLLHGHSGSKTLDTVLNELDIVMWGVALLGGSALTLLGMFWPGQVTVQGRVFLFRVFALAMERTGLILVGGAAAVYTYAILHAAASAEDVRYAAGIQLAYAIACFVRVGQIQRALKWSRRQVSHQKGL